MISYKPIIVQGGRRSDGTYLIYIRVYHAGKCRRVATHLTASPSQLTKKGQIKDFALLTKCSGIIARMRDAMEDVDPLELPSWDVGKVVEHIRSRIEGKAFSLDFFDFAEDFILTKKKATQKGYYGALNALEHHIGSRMLDINAITRPMLREFVDKYENATKVCYTNGVWRQTDKPKTRKGEGYRIVWRLAHIFDAAKERYNDEDSGRILIPRNPFRGFHFRITAKGQKPLTAELMQKVILAESDDWRVRTALDIFVVSFCLMGANMADLWDASPVDGVWKYNRHKVEDRREDGAPIECVIPPEVVPYAERLGGRGHWLDLRRLAKDSDHCGQFVVRHLSKWCESQGVPRFTLYAARHTWATLARKCGVELATVDQSLGHVGEFKVANIYAERNWELSHEANRRVLALFRWPE